MLIRCSLLTLKRAWGWAHLEISTFGWDESPQSAFPCVQASSGIAKFWLASPVAMLKIIITYHILMEQWNCALLLLAPSQSVSTSNTYVIIFSIISLTWCNLKTAAWKTELERQQVTVQVWWSNQIVGRSPDLQIFFPGWKILGEMREEGHATCRTFAS